MKHEAIGAGASRIYWVALASLVLILAVSACGRAESFDAPEPVRPVKLIEISASSNVRQINLPAVIEAAGTADVSFQVGGTLDELPVVSGQEVSKGAVLARLNQRDFRNSLQQAQAQFDSAESEFLRAERLISENAISRSVFEQRKTSMDVARASLDTARKALDDTVLRSPFDGVVADVYADQFQNVAPQEPILMIQTTGAAEALVQIPATLIAYSGNITPLETFIVLDAAPELAIPAEFYSSSTQADSTTQTFAVRFAFTPPDSLVILPGMSGSVHAKLQVADREGEDEQITVPLSAVISEADEKFVWVLQSETMTVTKRIVELDKGVGESLIVRSGLEVGDVIAGAGASYLFEGMKVRPYDQ